MAIYAARTMDCLITGVLREILPVSKEIENIPIDEGYLLEVLP